MLQKKRKMNNIMSSYEELGKKLNDRILKQAFWNFGPLREITLVPKFNKNGLTLIGKNDGAVLLNPGAEIEFVDPTLTGIYRVLLPVSLAQELVLINKLEFRRKTTQIRDQILHEIVETQNIDIDDGTFTPYTHFPGPLRFMENPNHFELRYFFRYYPKEE